MDKIGSFGNRHGSPDAKRAYNRALFDVVALRYDLVTRALSFFRDRAWKRALVGMLPDDAEAGAIIDMACGTGDLCAMLHRRFPGAAVIGMDLSPEMLVRAREKQGCASIMFTRQDMGQTGLKPQCAAAVTGGYALRNAPSLDGFILEVHRILKPGGCAFFLDFTRSPNRTVFVSQYLLLKFWGGFWGLIMHGNPNVYVYIAESLKRFPDRNKLHGLFRSLGFVVEQSKVRFFGMLELVKIRKE